MANLVQLIRKNFTLLWSASYDMQNNQRALWWFNNNNPTSWNCQAFLKQPKSTEFTENKDLQEKKKKKTTFGTYPGLGCGEVIYTTCCCIVACAAHWQKRSGQSSGGGQTRRQWRHLCCQIPHLRITLWVSLASVLSLKSGARGELGST